MAEEYKLVEADKLENNGDRVITEIEGREIAIFRYDDDYYAIANHCIHQGGPLCEGEMKGQMELSEEDNWNWDYNKDEKYVACPWHNWMFDVTTGVSPQANQYRIPTYDIHIKDGYIYVTI